MRWFLCVWIFVGCGDNLSPGPFLEITSPERGYVAEPTTVLVEGRVTSETGVLSVEVNGIRADVSDGGRFEVELELGPGTRHIVTIAAGANGAETRDVRTVSLGARADSAPISNGMIISVGSVGLGRVANDRLLPELDLTPIDQAVMSGPIADRGTDCEHDVVSVAQIDAPVAKLFLYGLLDGLGGELLYMPINTTMSADYADSGCNRASGTFRFETLELHVVFDVELQVVDGEPTVTAANPSHLYDHELFMINNNIDSSVFTRVTTGIEEQLADVLEPAGIDQYRGLLASWVNRFSTTRSLESTTLTSTLSGVSANSSGVTLAIDLEADEEVGAWVPTPTPAISPTSARAAIAIADDAVDQVLGVMWSVGAFDVSVAGGTARLSVPPSISGAAIEFGDWIVSTDNGTVAISGTVPLDAQTDGEVVALIPGEAQLQAQTLDGTPSLDTVLAESRATLVDRLREGLEVLMLPVGEATASSLELTDEGGYLVIDTLVPSF